jgi:RNA polymerase sigma-32 factor
MDIEMLEREEEVRLVCLSQAGDRRALDKLVRAYQPMIIARARKALSAGVRDIEDAIQALNVAFMLAVDKFEPHHGTRISTLAEFFMKSAVRDLVVGQFALTAAPSPKFASFLRHGRRLSRECDQNPDRAPALRAAFCEAHGISDRHLADMEAAFAPTRSLSDPVAAGDAGGTTIGDTIGDERCPTETDILDDMEDRSRRAWLAQATAALPPREQDIVRSRMKDPPETLDVLGERYGVSRERIRQIEERALMLLRKAARRR